MAERWPEPITPLSQSLLLDKFVVEFLYYHPIAEKLCNGTPPARVRDGYVYMNASMFHKLLNILKVPIPDYILELFPRQVRKRIDKDRWGIPSLSFLGLALWVQVKFRFLNKIDINILHNPKHWDSFVPYFTSQLERLKALDLTSQSDEELWKVYVRCEELLLQYRKIHLGSLLIANVFYQVLGMMLEKMASTDSGDLLNSLSAGLPGSKTIETNKAIWLLKLEVEKDKSLRNIFLNFASDEVLAMLNQPRFSEFKRRLHSFLELYGHRCSNSYELRSPSWKDDPTPVIEAIISYLKSDHCSDPFTIQDAQINQRIQAHRELRDLIMRNGSSSLTKARLSSFDYLISLFQKYILLRENQRFYFDMAIAMLKDMVRESARRLKARGLIGRTGDIYMLRFEEIRKALLEGEDFSPVAIQRAKEFQRCHQVSPPTYLFDDEPYEDGQPLGQSVLEGLGVSPGITKGKVRIIRSPKEFKLFKKGEILVAQGTDPGWTHLFVGATALVTEIGGLLSHGAVVAREYGLPAVVGVNMATKLLKNGQTIIVDGGKGIIHF